VPDIAEKPAAETAPPPVPEKKSSSLVVIVAVLVILLLGGAGVYFWAAASSKKSSAQQKPEKTTEVLSVVHLETFVVNIADPEQKAFLRVGIDLGLEKKPAKGEADGAPVALIRDTILGVLSVQKPDDLLTTEGKRKLKEDLLRALRQRAPDLGVAEVYFTEFLMQR
jgi:flagellar FliL protein